MKPRRVELPGLLFPKLANENAVGVSRCHRARFFTAEWRKFLTQQAMEEIATPCEIRWAH